MLRPSYEKIFSSVQVATTLCLFQCQIFTGGLAFGLSGTTATSQSLAPIDCSNDYLVFSGGYKLPITTPLNQRDRFCGNVFAQGASATTPDTICSEYPKLYGASGKSCYSSFIIYKCWSYVSLTF